MIRNDGSHSNNLLLEAFTLDLDSKDIQEGTEMWLVSYHLNNTTILELANRLRGLGCL